MLPTAHVSSLPSGMIPFDYGSWSPQQQFVMPIQLGFAPSYSRFLGGMSQHAHSAPVPLSITSQRYPDPTDIAATDIPTSASSQHFDRLTQLPMVMPSTAADATAQVQILLCSRRSKSESPRSASSSTSRHADHTRTGTATLTEHVYEAAPTVIRDTSNSKAKYLCSICTKAFRTSSAVRRHTRLHFADKPYKCFIPGCTWAFSDSTNCRRHIRTHQKRLQHPDGTSKHGADSVNDGTASLEAPDSDLKK